MQIYKTFQYIGTINDRKTNLDHNIKQENDLQRFPIHNKAIFTSKMFSRHDIASKFPRLII